jgi:PHP family Zn ribbon phosphoesterase
MVETLGPELIILRQTPIKDIQSVAGDRIAEGIRRVRAGQLKISAGYDGEYGVVKIFDEGE